MGRPRFSFREARWRQQRMTPDCPGAQARRALQLDGVPDGNRKYVEAKTGRNHAAPGADRKARANTKALKKLDLHWHDLRHECASRWRENGLDLEVIRRLLGHSTLLVTQRYLNINEDELVEAMQQKIWKRA